MPTETEQEAKLRIIMSNMLASSLENIQADILSARSTFKGATDNPFINAMDTASMVVQNAFSKEITRLRK